MLGTNDTIRFTLEELKAKKKALEEFYKLQARLLAKQQKLSEISVILGNITNEVSRQT